jgi:uncharacterized protein
LNRAEVLSLLESRREEIRHRFSVDSLSLFGSAARDEMRADSDVDVLVRFAGPVTFGAYMGLLGYLEELFQTKVDLVTEAMIKPRMRAHVEKDLIRVA